jgi:F-type H+-transporting ATPase subunit b
MGWLATLLLAGALVASAQEEKAEKKELGDGWKWANFAILALGLGYLASKNLPAFFKSRTDEIQKGIAEAQKIKEAADRRATDVEARVASLGRDIEQFRAQSKVEMQQEADRIRQETEAQIRRVEQQSEMEIESAGKAATRELKSYAAKLAMDLAEQRVRSRVDQGTDAGLIDGFVQDLRTQSSGGSKN